MFKTGKLFYRVRSEIPVDPQLSLENIIMITVSNEVTCKSPLTFLASYSAL